MKNEDFPGWFLFSLHSRIKSSPKSMEREGRDVGEKQRHKGHKMWNGCYRPPNACCTQFACLLFST